MGIGGRGNKKKQKKKQDGFKALGGVWLVLVLCFPF